MWAVPRCQRAWRGGMPVIRGRAPYLTTRSHQSLFSLAYQNESIRTHISFVSFMDLQSHMEPDLRSVFGSLSHSSYHVDPRGVRHSFFCKSGVLRPGSSAQAGRGEPSGVASTEGRADASLIC